MYFQVIGCSQQCWISLQVTGLLLRNAGAEDINLFNVNKFINGLYQFDYTEKASFMEIFAANDTFSAQLKIWLMFRT